MLQKRLTPRWIFSFLGYCLILSGTARAQPVELQAHRGQELLQGYELQPGGQLVRPDAAARLSLPNPNKNANLAAVIDLDSSSRQEVILQWKTGANYPFAHHFQVYRTSGHDAALLHELTFEGGPTAGIAYYKPTGNADTPKTVFEIMGGAKWSTWYLLAPDGKSTRKLGDGSDYGFIDFENHGTYNLVVYKERPLEPVCGQLSFMSLNPGLYPIVLRKQGDSYSQVWPPADWLPYDELDQARQLGGPLAGKRYAIMAEIYDLNRNGQAQIVALTGTLGNTQRALEVYQVAGASVTLQSQTAVANPDMAVVIYGIRHLRDTAQAVLLSADSPACGGLREAQGLDFRQGQFRPAWRRKFDQFYPYMPAALTDTGHTGEQEMTFPDSSGSPFLTLRHESEFVAPPAKVLCAIGCPPFCTDAYTKGPPCGAPGQPH